MSQLEISRPQKEEFGSYYSGYISKVDEDVMQLLLTQMDDYASYIRATADRLDFRYAEGKWSIRECLMHIVDTETIFAYRALRISRGDKTPLAGFDQDKYVEENQWGHITAEALISYFSDQRKATFNIIKHLTPSQMTRMGTASDTQTSVRALIYIIAGHAQHHLEIFRSRY